MPASSQSSSTTIVCGTDFSSASLPAVAAAAALASRLKGTLWIVHVLSPSARVQESSTIDTMVSGGRVWLEDQASKLQAKGNQQVQYAVLLDVVHGTAKTVADALMGFAEKHEAAVVVVASQGHSASSFLRVGTTSHALPSAGSVPVLVVRDAVPFEQWANEARPLRIVLGLDRSQSSERAIRFAKHLRTAGPCDLIVSHVYYAHGEAARYGISAPPSWLDEDPELERLIARDLERQVGPLAGDGTIVYRPKLGIGRLADHLLEVAEVEGADLVVVGTHRKHGLDRLASVSSVLLRYSHASVACIPTPVTESTSIDEIPKFRRVLVPTDLSDLSNRAIPYAYSILGTGPGELYLVHVVESPAEGLPLRHHPELIAKLRGLVPKSAGGRRVTTRTEILFGTEPAEAICQAAERFGSDIICLSSRGRSGIGRVIMGSTAEAVMRRSALPVFVVRPPRP